MTGTRSRRATFPRGRHVLLYVCVRGNPPVCLRRHLAASVSDGGAKPRSCHQSGQNMSHGHLTSPALSCVRDRPIYFDHAAATPVLAEVAAEHLALCSEHYANPHSTSWLGAEGLRAVADAERRLLELLGIPAGEADVVWTSGGTEAINLACQGVLRGQTSPCALVDAGAHVAVIDACRAGVGPSGREHALPLTRDGGALLDGLEQAFPRSAKGVFAVCHTNNETGAVHDLIELRRWSNRHAPGLLLVVDAIQSLSRTRVPWWEAAIDLLVISGRKIGGPASVAALIRRRGVELDPLFFGGGQQGGLRPGTMDVVGILEFVRAAEITCLSMDQDHKHVACLNARLREQLVARIDPAPVWISPPQASPYIVSFSFPGCEGAVLMRILAEHGIIVGTGSACSAESGEPSHVVRAMGFGEDVARGMLRVSFCRSSSCAEVDALASVLPEVLREY